jgi:hypothetical protein
MPNDDDYAPGSASSLIAIIEREFIGDDEPATKHDLARLYGVMAAQHEALIACFALAMQARPELIFTDRSVSAQKSLQCAVDAMTKALTDLATTPGDDEHEQ